jgi:hypothetical protein
MARPSQAKKRSDGSYLINRDACPDLDPLDSWEPVYRWEIRSAFDRIVELRPPTLFLIGARTHLPIKELDDSILRCGTGRSGSGGMGAGKVKKVTVDRASHFFPFQLVDKTATQCAQWLNQEVPKVVEADQAWKADRDQRLLKGEEIGLKCSHAVQAILDQAMREANQTKI